MKNYFHEFLIALKKYNLLNVFKTYQSKMKMPMIAKNLFSNNFWHERI